MDRVAFVRNPNYSFSCRTFFVNFIVEFGCDSTFDIGNNFGTVQDNGACEKPDCSRDPGPFTSSVKNNYPRIDGFGIALSDFNKNRPTTPNVMIGENQNGI